MTTYTTTQVIQAIQEMDSLLSTDADYRNKSFTEKLERIQEVGSIFNQISKELHTK